MGTVFVETLGGLRIDEKRFAGGVEWDSMVTTKKLKELIVYCDDVVRVFEGRVWGNDNRE